MIAKFSLICFSMSILVLWRVDQAEGTLSSDLSVSKVIEDVSKNSVNYQPAPPTAEGRLELINEVCGGPNKGEGLGDAVIRLPDGTWISIMKVRKFGTIFGVQNVGDGTYRRVLWAKHEFCAS